MTTDTTSPSQPTEPAAAPRMFGQRTYVLPDEVHTNLPRQGYDAEPPGWNRARGLLVELCRELAATPIALYHRPLETPTGNPNGVVVTAIVRDSHNQIVTVVWRRQHHPRRRWHQQGWQLTVNGVTPPRGHGLVPAAPPWLARIARSVIDG